MADGHWRLARPEAAPEALASASGGPWLDATCCHNKETPPAAAPGGVSLRQPLAGRWRKIVALRPRHDLLAPSPFRFGAPLTHLPGVGSCAW
jgi:hypothetical protein